MSQVGQPVRVERPRECSFGILALPGAYPAVVTIVAAKEQECVLVRLRPAVVEVEAPACLPSAPRSEQPNGTRTRSKGGPRHDGAASDVGE